MIVAQIDAEIERLQKAKASLTGATISAIELTSQVSHTRKHSDATRAAMSKAASRRWKRYRASQRQVETAQPVLSAVA